MEPTLKNEIYNNNINNINNNSSYCNKHKNEILILSCIECKILVCKKCILTHRNHNYEEIDQEKIFKIKTIINELEEIQKDLIGYKKSDSIVIEAAEYCYEKTKNNCKENIEFVDKILKQLSLFCEVIARGLKKKYITEQEINLDHFNEIIIEYNESKYNELIKENQEIINLNDHIELFEIYDEIKINENLKKSKEIINKNKNREKIDPFILTSIILNEKVFQEIKELIQNFLFNDIKENYKDDIIDNPYKKDLMLNKIFNPFLCQYYINHGEPIPNNVQEVAFDSNYVHNKLYIPNHVTKISLYNGYRLPIENLPNWLNVLVIWDIKEPLKMNSIPKSVNELYIRSGYNHPITEGVIPENVRELFICDLKYPLLKGSIGSNVDLLKIRNGYSHQLTEGIIPNSIITLYFGRLGKKIINNDNNDKDEYSQILTNDTLPKNGNLESIHFLQDFNQTIPNNFISKNYLNLTLEFYHFDQIKLFKNGIPSFIKKIIFHNHIKYKNLIIQNLIPPSIKIDFL